MGATGIDKSTWQDTEAKTGGFDPVPAGVGILFEITGVKEGTNKNDDEYIMFRCDTTLDSGDERTHWEYHEFRDERRGFLKSFLMGIGRADLMATDDADWADIEGTEFKGDVSHKEIKGEIKSNLNLRTLVPVSHDITEIPDGDEDERPEPKKKARGGSRR